MGTTKRRENRFHIKTHLPFTSNAKKTWGTEDFQCAFKKHGLQVKTWGMPVRK